MTRPNELTDKLKQCDPEIKLYIAALEAENAKLQFKIAKLQAENLSAENKIAALKETIKDNKPELEVIVRAF